MTGEHPHGEAARYEELSARIAATEAKLTAMQDQSEQANYRASDDEDRADADRDRISELEVRAEQANHRSDRSETPAGTDHDGIGALEGRADIDDLLIAELHAEGLVDRGHAGNLEAALRSSRTVGAAMGIVMAKHNVSEQEAFQMLREVSVDANRKLLDLADEIVLTGEVTSLTQ